MHIYTDKYIFVCMYIYMCVCACIYVCVWPHYFIVIYKTMSLYHHQLRKKNIYMYMYKFCISTKTYIHSMLGYFFLCAYFACVWFQG